MEYDALVNKLMQEIGLDVNDNNCIIDQDNGNLLQFNGKNLKYNTDRFSKADVPFDPIQNVKLMSHLFSYFTGKLNDEDGRYINIYYPVDIPNSKKGVIELKENNNTIRSNPYYNDSLKYADLIFKLSGEENVDLNEYDSEYQERNNGKK